MREYLYIYGEAGVDEALKRTVAIKTEEIPALQMAWSLGEVFFGAETVLDLRRSEKYWPVALLLVDDGKLA